MTRLLERYLSEQIDHPPDGFLAILFCPTVPRFSCATIFGALVDEPLRPPAGRLHAPRRSWLSHENSGKVCPVLSSANDCTRSAPSPTGYSSGVRRKQCKKFRSAGKLGLMPSPSPRSRPMRGRKPRPLEIAHHDVPVLQQIARSRSLPWFQIQRAQILLAVAAGEPVGSPPSAPNAIRQPSGESAAAMRSRAYPSSCDRPNGPGDRPGFPPCNALRSFSWPAWSRSPRACTLPTGRARIWPAKRSKMGSFRHQRPDNPSHPQSGGPPTASHSVLEDISNRRPIQAGAEKILWCYAYAERLARRGFGVVCADEKPNFQVLERHPIRPSIPGSIPTASSITRGTGRSTSWSS